MGAALGPVLANIIMTELERVVVDKLIGSGKIKFYACYLDDTLLLVKPEDIDDILNRFNAITTCSSLLTNLKTVSLTFWI